MVLHRIGERIRETGTVNFEVLSVITGMVSLTECLQHHWLAGPTAVKPATGVSGECKVGVWPLLRAAFM
jgi:hypothetical protein